VCVQLNPNKKTSLLNLAKKWGSAIGNSTAEHYYVYIAIVVAASFVDKLFVASQNVSLGADYGSYLRWADILRGVDIRGEGLRYPPLYPLMLNLFLLFFDKITALKICAALVYSIIIIPFFFLARRISKSTVLPIFASLLIAFNTFYAEMMGWGGNANILALTFMMTFLFFWFNSLEPERHNKRDTILASVFLSLSIGSHYLVGVYLAVFFLVFFSFLALFRRHVELGSAFRKTVLIGTVGLVFSIPYFFSYAYLLDSAVTEETSFTVAGMSISFTNYTYLLSKNIINIVLIFVGAIGIYILAKKKDRFKGLAIATLFISACLLLFTQHPDRWLYFWPIPMFLGIIVFIEFFSSKGRGFSRNILKSAVTLGVIFLALVYIINSINYLQETCSFYNALSNDSLAALKWISNTSNTPGNAVIATSGPYKGGSAGSGIIYGWWIEGYSNRRSIATAYLRFLTYKDERFLSEKANIIFSGTDIIKSSYVTVAETSGIGLGNPEIGVNIGDFYEKILFFADNESTISYNDGYSVSNLTLCEMKNNLLQDQNTMSLKAIYLNELISINRTMKIRDLSNVEISFDLRHETNITRMVIPLFKSDFSHLNDFNQINNKSVALYLTTPMMVYVQMNIAISYEGKVETNIFAETSPQEHQPLIEFAFLTPSKNASISFNLQFPKLINNNSEQVEYFNCYDLIKESDINYVMVNKNRVREWEWLSSDVVHFNKKFENEEIAIFEVLLNNFSNGQ
jgi:hypothetical protein